jgi:2-methylisocitrate lyase-like PEP mutase family enzyme
MTIFQDFKMLHKQNVPLYIGNVWDVNSAIMFERKGYKAIGTSSAAIAASLGYKDGENMSFEALFHIVRDIKAKTSLPLTVDLEAGYSRDSNTISRNIIRLSNLGIVGVNLEDSIVIGDNREAVDKNEFSETIKSIKYDLKEKEVFLNIRTDCFIMGLENALTQTIMRSVLYEAAGADGLFVPCVTHENDIRKIVGSISIPVNVMAMSNLPNFSKLQQLGVKRISSGPFLYNKINEYFDGLLEAIDEHQSFSPVFNQYE